MLTVLSGCGIETYSKRVSVEEISEQLATQDLPKEVTDCHAKVLHKSPLSNRGLKLFVEPIGGQDLSEEDKNVLIEDGATVNAMIDCLSLMEKVSEDEVSE